MLTIGGWIGVAVGIICVAVGIGVMVHFIKEAKTGKAVASVIIGIVLGAAIIIGVVVYANTESGKRAYKDQQSNFGGGINRTITVCDINGNVIKEYVGEFDVEMDNLNYVLFDDENGKRHAIFCPTGTIFIDEN